MPPRYSAKSKLPFASICIVLIYMLHTFKSKYFIAVNCNLYSILVRATAKRFDYFILLIAHMMFSFHSTGICHNSMWNTFVFICLFLTYCNCRIIALERGAPWRVQFCRSIAASNPQTPQLSFAIRETIPSSVACHYPFPPHPLQNPLQPRRECMRSASLTAAGADLKGMS